MSNSLNKIVKVAHSLCVILLLFFASCKEESVGLQPQHSNKPAPVYNVDYKPRPGGASITYTLPDVADLLYIKAVYERNGQQCESRASIYTDTLLVEGFGDTEPRTINIYAVDRSRNESDPYELTIIPDTPDILRIGESLEISADFGGIHLGWENPNRREISVWLMVEDSINAGEYVPLETFYSAAAKGNVAARGMDTLAVNVSVFVQDRWENRCETQYATITPLYEVLFDYRLITPIELPGDGPTVVMGSSWFLDGMWNGIWGGDNGYSSRQNTGNWPHSLTCDLGQTGKISRIRIHQRMGNYTWQEGNLRNFEIWGRMDINYGDGSWDGWTKLMECESIKPSGLPFGEYTAEDEAIARDGEDFTNDPANPPIRYLRIRVTRTWAGGDSFQCGEMEIFGDNRY
ncbi:MAG: DUF4959 domain-containing protein [Bacteroidales bacterium]|jgi:hypothetical protein|nr:DUF4959 domain-containing protein [Bacteroidales bacterium]